MHNFELLKKLERQRFSIPLIRKVATFLDRGFSLEGEIIIVGIFISARCRAKKFDDVLAACENEWKRSWQKQHPRDRANPYLEGEMGKVIRRSVENVLTVLDIFDPFDVPVKIHKGLMTVVAGNLTWNFGEAEESGARTVTKSDGQLPFSRCIIIELQEGKIMELFPVGICCGIWRAPYVISVICG